MRNLNKFMLLLISVSMAAITSCSSSDDGGSGGDAVSGTVKADVEGKTYQSMEIASSATVSGTGATKTLVIISANSKGEGIAMTIFGYEGAGKSYDFTGAATATANSASYSETEVNLNNPTASKTELWQAPYENTLAGTVAIKEETDSKIVGTFNFKAKNVLGDGSIKNVEGSFDLKKRNQ